MSSDTSMGEALLALLSGLFQQDPLIDEIGLLFGIEPSDLTPETAFFLEEHKIGVSFAAGIPLFQAARNQFHQLNALLQQDAAEMLQSDTRRRDQLLHCTRAILLISADFYTAWNTRKAFVARGWLDAQDEVQFTNLVFTLHPKSIDTWAYRRWLAIRLCEVLSGDDLRGFFKQQTEICGRLAELKVRNYHAWSFRHWIVSRLPLDLILEELVEMDHWCRTHVTDHSGWNHRQHTLNQLVKWYQDANKCETIQSLILTEFKFVSDVMAPYPTHEALWCHRRYVVQRLLGLTSHQKTSNDAAPFHQIGLVCELNDRMLDILSNTKPTKTEELAASWNEVYQVLNGCVEWPSILQAILQEIKISWECGTRFSRRYSVWCLARLRGTVERVQNDALAIELHSLASTLQKHLRKEDDVLEDLWLRA